jgi:membrane-associated phospholipid phosphatase
LGLAGLALLSVLLIAGEGEFLTFRRVLPLILIPMAYWQTGQFTGPLNQGLQVRLASIDERILHAFGGISLPARVRHWLTVYLETAYLFVYPMVPSGLAVLYFGGALERINEFWTVVLPPAYFSYATLPFLRTLPPRALEAPRERDQPVRIRAFNLIVVRLITHQANTFPSGHSAAATAVALELIRFAPPVGAVYAVIAISIMLGAFVGRYHYAADLLLGAALACVSFLLAPR